MFLMIRRCAALLMWAPLVWAPAQAQGLVQDGDPNASVSTEVHKCVRAGEIFYTNGACPAGTSPARLNQPGQARAVAAQPVRAPQVEYWEPRPEPAGQRPAPRAAAQVPLAEPVYQGTLTTVRAHELVPSRAPEPESDADSQGFLPLSAFPRLPESGGGGRAGDQAHRAPVEAPMRGPVRQAEPVADARASNGAMCGFVQAELDRLAVESASASADEAKARIAVHQKRLHDRHAQLRC